MKNLLFTLAVLALGMMTSCSSDENESTENVINGKWYMTQVDYGWSQITNLQKGTVECTFNMDNNTVVIKNGANKNLLPFPDLGLYSSYVDSNNITIDHVVFQYRIDGSQLHLFYNTQADGLSYAFSK
ncbi:MAG: hypothetical protein IJ614_05365 [Prevotella sp.]|nr:hypothetical protein [Prevotella sp.]